MHLKIKKYFYKKTNKFLKKGLIIKNKRIIPLVTLYFRYIMCIIIPSGNKKK